MVKVEEKPSGFLGFFQKSRQKIHKNQMIKERGFTVEPSNSEKNIVTVESLLESINKENQLEIEDKLGVTALIASAGSGKTTLLRQLTRQTLVKNAITKENDFAAAEKRRLRMVNYIELKNVPNKESISVPEFLFGGTFKNDEDREDVYEWLLNNQSEVVLFFDGLDQANFKIGEEKDIDMEPHGKASSATLMYNLLARKLLPHVQIVITSREFSISALQADARPRNIVQLTGFSQQDAKKLFLSLMGDKGDEAWRKLCTSSRGLLHFISIPALLVLTAIVMSRDSTTVHLLR